MNFGRWHSTYPINESDDRFSAGQRCGQYHLIREGLAFRTFPLSPTLLLLSFLWISHLPIYTLPWFRKIYNVFDFAIKSLRERQQSRQSPIWPKHLHRLPLDCKTQKHFSCISPISPPSCLPERRISLFSFGFCLGHLILGSTSLGSVQNLMTFAWHWQCRIVQGNARSVYFVRFVNSSSESRPKCWPFLLRCSLWLLSTRRDPYHAVSSNILFYFFFIPLILFVHRSMLSWSFFYSHANEVRTFTEGLN